MGKRGKEGFDARGGNKKAKYQTGKAAALRLGSRGFLISCIASKEKPASQEALNILQATYDAASASKAEPAATTNDISSELDREIADLKDPKKQVFKIEKTGITGLIFVEMDAEAPGPGPSEILVRIAEEVKRTMQCNSRLCMRFSPVDTICTASLQEMQQAAARVVPRYFPADEGTAGKSFAVQYDHRASASFDRKKVIDAVLAEVKQPPHKANLSNPDLAIVVQVMKNICAIGVAPRFREFAKYNFQELCNPEREEGAKTPAKAAEQKPAEEADAGSQDARDGAAVEASSAEAGVEASGPEPVTAQPELERSPQKSAEAPKTDSDPATLADQGTEANAAKAQQTDESKDTDT